MSFTLLKFMSDMNELLEIIAKLGSVENNVVGSDSLLKEYELIIKRFIKYHEYIIFLLQKFFPSLIVHRIAKREMQQYEVIGYGINTARNRLRSAKQACEVWYDRYYTFLRKEINPALGIYERNFPWLEEW